MLMVATNNGLMVVHFKGILNNQKEVIYWNLGLFLIKFPGFY